MIYRDGRRLTVIFLGALMIAALLPTPTLAQSSLPVGGTFVDDDGSIHEPAIEAIAAVEITLGCDDRFYCPDDAVTRGQMASFLDRALGLGSATQDWFGDDDGSVHEASINAVAEAGIALGFDDGTFRPATAVTRAQMASFLDRALGLAPATQDWFGDDDGSVHEASINAVAEAGIALGFDDGTYRPTTAVTRAQMASFLLRGLDLDPITPPVETAVYFFLDSLGDDPLGPGPFLVPAARAMEATSMPATAALELLLDGPTVDEMTAVPAIGSSIPAGTELNGVTISNGVATVDLSSQFESGGGSASMLGRVAEVVFTLTQFSTVDEVMFELDGTPIDTLGGEGIILDAYNTRVEVIDQLPSVFVDVPAHGGIVGNPIEMSGWTAADGGAFMVTVVDDDGLILTEVAVMAVGDQTETPGGVTWTTFDTSVAYEVDSVQTGAVIVWVESDDGSQLAVREYPVRLIPAR